MARIPTIFHTPRQDTPTETWRSSLANRRAGGGKLLGGIWALFIALPSMESG